MPNRSSRLALPLGAAVVLVAGWIVPGALAASRPAPTAVSAEFAWGSSLRVCEHERSGSVICISAKGTIQGAGEIEYARDAVPTDGQTTDGCPKYSTHAVITVAGGTAIIDGKPAATCGGTDSPDAHYLYTISGGTGVLAGASGTGDIVADHGVDKWHGTFIAPHAAPGSLTIAADTPESASTPAAAVSPTVTASPVVDSARGASASARRVPARTGRKRPWYAVGIAFALLVACAATAFIMRRRRARSGV